MVAVRPSIVYLVTEMALLYVSCAALLYNYNPSLVSALLLYYSALEEPEP
jgi:hypothetical protein